MHLYSSKSIAAVGCSTTGFIPRQSLSYLPQLPKEAIDDHIHIQFLQMSVFLPSTDKHDGLTRLIRHAEGGAYLLIHRVKLGQNDPINLMLLACMMIMMRRYSKKKGSEGDAEKGRGKERSSLTYLVGNS